MNGLLNEFLLSKEFGRVILWVFETISGHMRELLCRCFRQDVQWVLEVTTLTTSPKKTYQRRANYYWTLPIHGLFNEYSRGFWFMAGMPGIFSRFLMWDQSAGGESRVVRAWVGVGASRVVQQFFLSSTSRNGTEEGTFMYLKDPTSQ